MASRASALSRVVVVILLTAAAGPRADLDAQGGGNPALGRVAEAILAWDGRSPGDLFKAVKAANPDAPAIVSMRELNKALSDKAMPPEVAKNAEAIIRRQKTAQARVRSQVLATRTSTYNRFRGSNPGAFRSVYGSGDIGSWSTSADPDASMDVDWTVFGTDPAVTAELRDQCKADLLKALAGDDSGLTLADFDVVITAEGHEAAAGAAHHRPGVHDRVRPARAGGVHRCQGVFRHHRRH